MELEDETLNENKLPGSNENDVDEPDYILTSKNEKEKNCFVCKQEKFNNNNIKFDSSEKEKNNKKHSSSIFKLKPKKLNESELKVCVKNNFHTLDRLHLFKFYHRKQSDPSCDRLSVKSKPKFSKSITIAKLFGNNYNPSNSVIDSKNKDIITAKPPPYKSEKFNKADSEKVSQNEDTQSLSGSSLFSSEINASQHHHHMKPFKTISRSFGKLLRRNYSSVDISVPDPEYKVSYLGNVLTGWARGDNCMEKPISTLWRNYTQNNKPDVLMRLRVTPSGLKASTRQHGLTEYWAHRITFCSAPKNYPRVFCWIYRHEGRKLKHELRCHAVICSKESIANDICNVLKENLAIALQEFKREKVNRQNARLSLANSVYENPTMPRRKIMLSVGGTNYRPPLERSKSAPKLMAIEEAITEEEEQETQEDAVKRKDLEQMKNCCKESSLFPSTTLGRRKCRRGHSIRRSRLRNSISRRHKSHDTLETSHKIDNKIKIEKANASHNSDIVKSLETQINLLEESRSSEEDFEKFLAKQNYESSEILSGEFLAYLNSKLNQSTNSLHNIDKSEGNVSSLKNTLSLDNLDNYKDENECDKDESNKYFNQSDILDLLHEIPVFKDDLNNDFNSCHHDMDQQLSDILLNTHINDTSSEPPSIVCISKKNCGVNLDSDEGSISSGCETSSTMTTATNDEPRKPCSVLDRIRNFEQLSENPTKQSIIGARRRHDSASSSLPNTDNMSNVFVRSVTIPAPGTKPNYALPVTHKLNNHIHHRNNHLTSNTGTTITSNNLVCNLESIDSDSELSDESGYVEYQENNNLNKKKTVVVV
uniref:CSON014594 protein n=1 Tax=Culicoides sonorensis TaxID=179676 RepID=A0A336MF04_CULSO